MPNLRGDHSTRMTHHEDCFHREMLHNKRKNHISLNHFYDKTTIFLGQIK